MSRADYYICPVCDGKALYDSSADSSYDGRPAVTVIHDGCLPLFDGRAHAGGREVDTTTAVGQVMANAIANAYTGTEHGEEISGEGGKGHWAACVCGIIFVDHDTHQDAKAALNRHIAEVVGGDKLPTGACGQVDPEVTR